MSKYKYKNKTKHVAKHSAESSDFYLNNIKYDENSSPLSYEYEWLADGPSKICMTVAMPLKKMNDISWIALESLRRQEGVNFDWELIIFEDGNLSRKVLDEFIGKLPRCKRILYKSIDLKTDGRSFGKFEGSVPLIDKWVGMAQAASAGSIGYVLQAGDVYSPKRMLKNHFKNFKNKNCIYSTYPKGLFYHLGLKKKIFYNGYNFKSHGKDFLTIMHLYMAVRTSDIKKIRPSFSENEKNRLIDKYIRVNIYKNRKIDPTQRKYIYNVDDIDPDDWMSGFNTDGLNTISWRKKIYENPEARSAVWSAYNNASKNVTKYSGEFEDIIPSNVIEFINSINKVRKNR